jgi:hypothetical protein
MSSLSIFGLAQSNHIDTSYIKEFRLQNGVQLYLGRTDHRFQINSNTNQRRRNNVFFPNEGLYNGFFFNYGWISLSYSKQIKSSFPYPVDRNLKSSDLNLFKFWDRFGIVLDKVKMNGLLYREQRNHQKPIILKNIDFTSYTADLYIILNKKFSYRAAVYSSKKQIKSTGSPLIILTPSYNQFKSSRALESAAAPQGLKTNILFKDPIWKSIKTSIGYGYNFCFKQGKFIVNPNFSYSFSFNTIKKSNIFTYNNGTRFSLNAGYHGEKYFAILNANLDKYNSKLSKSSFNQSISDICLSVGTRFNKISRKIIF